MSVRVRRQDGSAVQIKPTEAVEILGLDGKVAVVIYTARKGTIQVLTDPDPLFTAYCRSQGLHKSDKVKVHETFTGKPVPL